MAGGDFGEEIGPSSGRLADLERRFSQLEAELKAGPEKETLSILHALIHEGWRRQAASAGNEQQRRTLEDVANLYKSAPPMEGAAENEGLAAGAQAPDFALPGADGRPVSLHDFRGRTVVLVFYPLDWSPGCSDQLSLYQDELQEFAKYGAQLLAVSVDSIYSHGAWAAVRGLSIPLLSDFHPKGEVARRYQVYRDNDGFSERALFVLDAEGVIRYAYISPQLHQVPDIYGLFAQLQSLSSQA